MNKGFAPIVVIVSIAVLLGIGGGAWYSWTKTGSLSPIVWLENITQLKEDISTASSSVSIFGKEDQDRETAQFYEMKKKYENKKWRGTIKGEEIANNPALGGYTKTYTARIDEMKMIFNGPYSDPALLRDGELLSSVAIGGKAVLESAHISMTCGELNIEISSFPFNLDGGVDFPNSRIGFTAAHPEADKDFKVLYTTTCGDPDSFYGDDEQLWHIFEPANAVFKFEGDKIILAAEFSDLNGDELFKDDTTGIFKNTDSKVKISGELTSF